MLGWGMTRTDILEVASLRKLGGKSGRRRQQIIPFPLLLAVSPLSLT
jgi:hypothetical protein